MYSNNPFAKRKKSQEKQSPQCSRAPVKFILSRLHDVITFEVESSSIFECMPAEMAIGINDRYTPNCLFDTKNYGKLRRLDDGSIR